MCVFNQQYYSLYVSIHAIELQYLELWYLNYYGFLSFLSLIPGILVYFKVFKQSSLVWDNEVRLYVYFHICFK